MNLENIPTYLKEHMDIEAALLYSIQQVTAFAKEHEAEFV